ncbi:MAG: HNH endonuclease [Spiribacter salinus]|uniref:Putative HNH nuclease YajD n=1 Tax=Spiribacter salinus TaxID=1335746 RepID=A0A540VAE9_9GAMM|nr:MAG: HNH endonuclease [Spiribacter salinus]
MAKWPYNSQRWQRLRRQQLGDEPLCRYCMEIGRVTPATVVDHIKRVVDEPDLAFDASNLQSLCTECHNSVKRSEEERGYRKGFDVNGMPLDPLHPWSHK